VRRAGSAVRAREHGLAGVSPGEGASLWALCASTIYKHVMFTVHAEREKCKGLKGGFHPHGG
jgi:hypothetical protein